MQNRTTNPDKNDFLYLSLKKREEQGSLRSLSINNGLVDFCSNDYLGYARSKELRERIHSSPDPSYLIGSTGSRLLSGNSKYIEELEYFIANYHKAAAGLIYNSGYDANIGLFPAIAKRGDTIIYDELIHASVHDAMRISLANSYSFRHNNTKHLEEKLKRAKGKVFIAVESVYSMDGDFSPLKEITKLCDKYNAFLIVDEAHATGIYGKKGEGRVCELNLQEKTFARIHTFGKALGCHGAIVLGNENLRNYLINFSRSFIYTTAMPFYNLKSIKIAYDILSIKNNNLLIINDLVRLFKQKINSIENLNMVNSFSPIQSILFDNNNEVKILSQKIQKSGYDVRAILHPTVPKGKERLRICLHSYNTEKEIDGLVNSISNNIFPDK